MHHTTNAILHSSFQKKILSAAAFSILLFVFTNAQTTSVANIYVSPNGVDTNSGLARTKPVKTLTRVHEIIKAASPNYNINVNIKNGTYVGQHVVWKYTMPNHSITFRPDPENTAEMPIFQKCAGETSSCSEQAMTWFTLRQSNGLKSNLIFSGLNIRYYETAISLNGDRNSQKASNGSNQILDMLFESVGKGSTAIVRFVNSKNNTVKNSEFIRGPGTTILHAIYVAHYSSGSVITNNRFEQISGSPISIRDQSNNTIVSENVFVRNSNGPIVSLYFCDKSEQGDACTKPGYECPSINNQVRNNIWDRRQMDGKDSKMQIIFDSQKTAGDTRCPTTIAPRFSTGGNTISKETKCTFNGKKILHGEKVIAYFEGKPSPGKSCVSQSRTCSMGVLFGSYKYPSCSKN